MAKLTKERLEYLSNELKKYKADEELHKKALKALNEKVESILSTVEENGNTIAYTTSRIKTVDSFINKQNRNKDKGLNIDYEDMHDIIGARLVCLTKSDLNACIKVIEESPEFEVVEIRDYINGPAESDRENYHILGPKKSGYRSFHILVRYPIFEGTTVRYITAEIQLRTIFMDIFAREEHKINYKGNCSEEDKAKLLNLSKKLAFYDWSLDNFKLENKSKNTESYQELAPYISEYGKVSYIFGKVFDDIKPEIEKSIDSYKYKDDILHFVYGIKPIESIKRKLVRKGLSCSAENMLYKLRDVVRFKIVCVDEKTAKDYIEIFESALKQNDKIIDIKSYNYLDTPKETGYRGYKINASYIMPVEIGNPITFEVIITTMFKEAWAELTAKVYADKVAQEKYKDELYGLSESLHDEEETVAIIKNNNKINPSKKAENTLKKVIDYDKKKKQ